MSFRGKRKDGEGLASDENEDHAPPNKVSKVSSAVDSDDSDDVVVCEVTLHFRPLFLHILFQASIFFPKKCHSRALRLRVFLFLFLFTFILNKVYEMWNSFCCELQISKNRRVSVRNWNGKIWVDVREFYVKDGKQLPGKKGTFSSLCFISKVYDVKPVLFFSSLSVNIKLTSNMYSKV